jgi:cell division septation protein DedD
MHFSGRHLIAAGAFALFMGAGSALADVKAGVDAWQAGNYPAAVKEWRALAEKGDADAQFNLGQAYKLGRGVPADLKAAQGWYEKAAASGHSQAQANLGLILFQNGQRQQALPWITKAADAGDPRAQYVLGTALFNGDLVGKDWPRAYALMQRAAAQGLPQAGANLQQMDKFIPLPQRQQGLALARRMEQAAPAAKPAPVQVRPQPTPVGQTAVPPSDWALTSSTRPAPSAQRPQPKPAVQAAVAQAGGGWGVQLGAFGTATNAKRHWDGLRGKVAPLASLQPSFVAAGAVTRLQAGPLASRAAADKVCAAAKAAGAACFPVAR